MAFQVTEVQKALKGADYPMSGPELARRNGAGDDLAGTLEDLPQVDGPNAVMARLKGNLGGSTEGS